MPSAFGMLVLLFAANRGLTCPSSSTCITGASGTHSSCLSNSGNLVTIHKLSKAAVLAAHNNARASSSLRPKPNPTLPRLSFNQDLATTAERYAAACKWGHDTYPNRKVFSEPWGSCIGQNLYASTKPSAIPMSSVVESWFGEIKDWKYGMGSTNGLEVGHFTQVVWNTTLYVGCGQATCSSLRGSPALKTVTVCNYGPCGNDRGRFRYPY